MGCCFRRGAGCLPGERALIFQRVLTQSAGNCRDDGEGAYCVFFPVGQSFDSVAGRVPGVGGIIGTDFSESEPQRQIPLAMRLSVRKT